MRKHTRYSLALLFLAFSFPHGVMAYGRLEDLQRFGRMDAKDWGMLLCALAVTVSLTLCGVGLLSKPESRNLARRHLKRHLLCAGLSLLSLAAVSCMPATYQVYFQIAGEPHELAASDREGDLYRIGIAGVLAGVVAFTSPRVRREEAGR
jgi:hypothetical protein